MKKVNLAMAVALLFLAPPVRARAKSGETMRLKMARSEVKHVDIRAPYEKVYEFISNPLNWPKYAIVNLRSVETGRNGWFKTVTKFGEGELKMSAVKELGIIDHTWKDPQASWTVPARVVRNGGGTTVMMTIFQPPVMTDAQFDSAMREMDIEMAKLKEVLEGD
jgi:hypothetical protein